MKRLFVLFLTLSSASSVWARHGVTPGPLNIRSVDGSVSAYPYQAKFSTGTVTDNSDGTVTINTTGSGITSTTSTWSAAQTFSSATITNPRLAGTATNDNAAAGFYGEYISSVTGSTNFPSTGNYGDLATITLTAGDWDVTAIMDVNANGATVTVMAVGISTTTGNSSAGLIFGDNALNMFLPTVAFDSGGSIPHWRQSLSGTTIIYLKYEGAYSVAIPQARGRLSARRVR